MENYKQGIGIAAGGMMLRWTLLEEHIKQSPIGIKTGDNVDVFINFECILKNLSSQRGLIDLVNFHKQQTVIELESSILNLIANYRMYFSKEKCNTRVFLYYTDLGESDQLMFAYNKYYRTYYQNRYLNNPTFRQMGELLISIIIPEVELILNYVPGCYFIRAKRFDGSLIPYIISTLSRNKNVIISGDVFDTLYMFDPNFITLYLKRRFQYFSLTSDIESTVRTIIKDESPFDLNLFNSEMYYRLLLSIKGSRVRNIRSAKGFGYGKFLSILKRGIENGIVLKDFSSLDSIIQLFPELYRDDIKLAFKCTSIETQYGLLGPTDIDSISSQIIDKVDIKSLEALNNKRFLEFPINLQGLLN